LKNGTYYVFTLYGLVTEAWKKPGILKLKNLEFKKKSVKKPGISLLNNSGNPE
jgi:hypothetical protein